MQPIDYAVNLLLGVLIVIGIYQVYFWCQRRSFVASRELPIAADDWVPYLPGWTWVYGLALYPPIVCVNFVATSTRDFVHYAASYAVLLILHSVVFLLFPVVTPERWRAGNRGATRAERLLRWIQHFDSPANSFPSMHVSVSVLTAMHLAPHVGPLMFLFPLVISLSCLFTKQHYLLDLPPAILFAWMAERVQEALQ